MTPALKRFAQVLEVGASQPPATLPPDAKSIALASLDETIGGFNPFDKSQVTRGPGYFMSLAFEPGIGQGSPISVTVQIHFAKKHTFTRGRGDLMSYAIDDVFYCLEARFVAGNAGSIIRHAHRMRKEDDRESVYYSYNLHIGAEDIQEISLSTGVMAVSTKSGRWGAGAGSSPMNRETSEWYVEYRWFPGETEMRLAYDALCAYLISENEADLALLQPLLQFPS